MKQNILATGVGILRAHRVGSVGFDVNLTHLTIDRFQSGIATFP